MTTNEKIALLRSKMQAAGADICLIPSSDPHTSEYLPDHWAARSYFSGFTGSVGTLVVTESASALWVDGRYFIQAERQLMGSEITLQRMGVDGVPTVVAYIGEALPQDGVLALDGMVTPTATVQQLEKAIAAKGGKVLSVDLVEGNWENRPPVPATPAFLLSETYAGQSASEKLTVLRKELVAKKATATLVTQLASVAWLLNLRASDIDCTPFALAYCFVTQGEAMLFVDTSRLAHEATSSLVEQGVQIFDYNQVVRTLTGYHHDQTVLADASGMNWTLYTVLNENPAFALVEGCDPIIDLKAIKNETEIASLKESHAKDGVAMVRFQIWLEQQLASGATVTEVDVETELLRLRGEQALNKGASFDTIAAYRGNAAMMHYHATPGNCTTLKPEGFLLVDCGGQYLDGTTDITRTYALGDLTENERTYYTYVLQSHIEMARLQFMAGCTGGNLDIIARAPIWSHGLDYRCGTGHGVGFFGGVHEGPQNLRINNTTVFKPGMVITDEPGIYEEGEVGIRIENELLCVTRQHTDYGTFLGFEPLTFCPIDLTAVRKEWLTTDQTAWLNDYHALVYRTLAPRLTESEAAWLKAKTAAI